MEETNITEKYWTERDKKDLGDAKSFKDLFIVAKSVLAKMNSPVIQVCGPISTGGLGSLEANLNAFNTAIKKLQQEGFSVFDQLPFEDPMQRLKNIVEEKNYLEDMFNDFYYPIFSTGLISAMYFMPHWETSGGATKEHNKAKELGIEIVYL